MAEIRLNNLTKRWGLVTGVKDLNLTIADQEFLVLLGPSGCGKSTTMRMIAGLEDVTEGEIWIGDRMVNTLEPKDRDISMVFQSYGLYPNMSVYENIRFPLKVRKVPKEQHHERVMRAAGMVHLTDFLDRRPAELSGGQRQRVALGRAIVREPTVFLMDEPLSNLDAKLRVSTRAEIKNLQYQLKTTMIYVTHDQIEAMTLADRVVVMDRGVVQQVATPTEMYENPANTFVAGFIGSPAMNLVEGDFQNGTFRAQNIEVSGFPDVASGRVTLGFRAEDVDIVPQGGQIAAPAFAVELLGEMTMIAVEVGGDLVNLKAVKTFRPSMGEDVHAALDCRRCHLFDVQTGKRLTERFTAEATAAG